MIIAVVGQKGGTGKTTLTLNLAEALQDAGYTVLVGDADPQGSARIWAQRAAEHDREVCTVVGVGANMNRQGQLRRLAEGYDLALVDCPPKRGEVLRAALLTAGLALIPIRPTPQDLDALGETLDVVQMAKELNPGLQVAVVVSQRPARAAIADAVVEALRAIPEVMVLTTEIRARVIYQEAHATGSTAYSFTPPYKAKKARAEITELAGEVVRMAAAQAESQEVSCA